MGFGLEYLSTELPQMRTIPIGKSIDVKHNVSPFDEISTLLNKVAEPFVIVECICRKKKNIEGKECKVTSRKETCMAVGPMGESVLETGMGRQITREEAIDIIEQNQKEGLVLQPSNTEDPEFICSCCGCCCGIMSTNKSLPKPLDFWASNYIIEMDADLCNGCGRCVKNCQMDAIQKQGPKEPVKINLNHCIGCGVCVVACPKDALELKKKEEEVVPPKTREDLYEIIMENKRGGLGKVKLVGKLIFDSVRTGDFRMFK
jgi:NAD-dependent dihydropyrimidine dehydrogenase PreA subunit